MMACNKSDERTSLLSPGISLELAKYRKQQVSRVVYNLSFNIPLAKDAAIASKLDLGLQINDLEHPLYLDFKVDSSYIKRVEVNKKQIPINHQKEHLIIAQEFLSIGQNIINIQFDAGELSLNKNDDYLYTLLVPDRASTLFPCFDQPNVKAHYNLSITAPKDWEVLCASEIELKEEQGEFTRYKFKKSDLMSTYLFSFVAGVFQKTNKQLGNFNMNMLYRENDQDKIDASKDQIFKLHHESLLFLEDYTQYKFPFQKLDLASIPGFQYGGMEHVGAIQYREPSLFFDNSATQRQELSRCKLIAHETAHMWFGDLVTMDWFDDVWLKEVFANFMADKITNPAFPNINHRLNFMSEHYPSAYSEDRTKGATPIKQKLGNLKDAGTLYGGIIYNKAPIVMRQLEALLGEDAFKKGIQNYIKKFAYANADWNDLVTILQAETNQDLKQWSAVWINKSGRPIISDKVIYKDNKIKHFEIIQNAEDGSDHIWPQRFKIGLVYKDSIQQLSVLLDKKKVVVNNLIGSPQPDAIIYNYDAFGYGVFPMNHLNINSLPKIEDEVARAYSYINLYENVLSGNIHPLSAFEVLVEGISMEKEELILNNMVGELSSIFWNFTPLEERDKLGVKLEDLLVKRLKAPDLPASLKKTLFNFLEGIAYSEKGKALLHRIWSKSLSFENLNLNEEDYTGLACTLSVFNHPDSEAILKKAMEAISNPDRKERIQFLLPSLSNNEKERDDFMVSLANAKNREKESWVLSALYNIHHPLRQESAKKHLKMCLSLVEEIQKTGDIFFPSAWLEASIGNYTSEYAYSALEQFLNEHPKFPLVLKNKLLQATDNIYRAKMIRDTWQ